MVAFTPPNSPSSGADHQAGTARSRDFPSAVAQTATSLQAHAILGIPSIRPGSDLVALISQAIEAGGHKLVAGDVMIVAQKIVSKAEGRYVDLAGITPSERAITLGQATGKDPRLVEVILSQSKRVVRHRLGVLIVEHRLGFVVANAGVDQSNVDPTAGAEPVLLLPENPDDAASHLQQGLGKRFNCDVAVVISDSFGRAWRLGTVGIAIGAAGLPALMDLRGRPDLFARPLQSTEIGFADEIAATASLLMGQASEACPVVLIRGLRWSAAANPAARLLRSPDDDLFR